MKKENNAAKETHAVEAFALAANDAPAFQESARSEWVSYGHDNAYPAKLVELSQKSALHNAIISSKVDSVAGAGATYEGEPNAQTDALISSPNPDETLDDILYKLAYDEVLFGGFAIEVILAKDKKRIAEMRHIDFTCLRSGKEGEDGKVAEYWYSKCWAKARQAEFKPVMVPAYARGSKEPRQVMYVKEYRPTLRYYPLPSYIGALAYVEIDAEIANFHLAHIRNGMSPSLMINFNNGIPEVEKRKAIKKQISDTFTGSENAGKFILNFSDDKDHAPDVTTISPSQLDKQFIQLQETVMQNILSGHKITNPLLVGIKTPGQLGGTNELQASFAIYYSQVIEPLQKLLIGAINAIGAVNGCSELEIDSVAPVEFTFSENIMSQILTQDEMRAKIGYAPAAVQPAQTENNPTANGN